MGRYLNSSTPYALYQGETNQPYFEQIRSPIGRVSELQRLLSETKLQSEFS